MLATFMPNTVTSKSGLKYAKTVFIEIAIYAKVHQNDAAVCICEST